MCLTADCLRFLRSVTTDKARGYSDTGPCLPVAPSKEKITGEGIHQLTLMPKLPDRILDTDHQ